jgi:hypothetical protein
MNRSASVSPEQPTEPAPCGLYSAAIALRRANLADGGAAAARFGALILLMVARLQPVAFATIGEFR